MPVAKELATVSKTFFLILQVSKHGNNVKVYNIINATHFFAEKQSFKGSR